MKPDALVRASSISWSTTFQYKRSNPDVSLQSNVRHCKLPLAQMRLHPQQVQARCSSVATRTAEHHPQVSQHVMKQLPALTCSCCTVVFVAFCVGFCAHVSANTCSSTLSAVAICSRQLEPAFLHSQALSAVRAALQPLAPPRAAQEPLQVGLIPHDFASPAPPALEHLEMQLRRSYAKMSCILHFLAKRMI